MMYPPPPACLICKSPLEWGAQCVSCGWQAGREKIQPLLLPQVLDAEARGSARLQALCLSLDREAVKLWELFQPLPEAEQDAIGAAMEGLQLPADIRWCVLYYRPNGGMGAIGSPVSLLEIEDRLRELRQRAQAELTAQRTRLRAQARREERARAKAGPLPLAL